MYAVILAGGGGTRLWPLSRAERPKPFLPLFGTRSLLQGTVDRLQPDIPPEDVYVVTDARYAELVREQLPSVPAGNVLSEPVGRNTAAAVCLAALMIERPADDVMVILPADHRIADEASFRAALADAAGAAAGGRLVTLGIRPSGPETGYGYVLAAAAADDGDGLDADHAPRPVERFVEKPGRDRARELIETGRASWNAGIFIWSRGTLLECLERFAPSILGPIRTGLLAGRDPAEFYPAVPSTSVDYALLEPASTDGLVAVVPADIGWSDVGSWAALLDALAGDGDGDGGDGTSDGGPADGAGVVRQGRSIDLGSEDVLVHSAAGRLVVTLGLRGTIVVDTPDVVLVCARDHAQDVKRIVDGLAAAKETDLL